MPSVLPSTSEYREAFTIFHSIQNANAKVVPTPSKSGNKSDSKLFGVSAIISAYEKIKSTTDI
jgi:hypothetical protein